jgi:hypothetical protein
VKAKKKKKKIKDSQPVSREENKQNPFILSPFILIRVFKNH